MSAKLLIVINGRSRALERIDTGDYTLAEYERFLVEIKWINRYLGDARALKKTLLREIASQQAANFSVLDVGAGSGELLRQIAGFARLTKRDSRLVGLDLSEISSAAIERDSAGFPEIAAVRADALNLPFPDDSFDYVISSLFLHHLSDGQIISCLHEMSRVARRGVVAIDLHRHRLAYVLYKIFCAAFGISELVTADGSLSVLKGFKPAEFHALARSADAKNITVSRHFPFRVVLRLTQPDSCKIRLFENL